MPGGNSESRRLDFVPLVTTVWPFLTVDLGGRNCSSRSLGLPAAVSRIPESSRLWTVEDTPLEWSVMSVTIAASEVVSVTLPTRPAPSTTGWLRCTPSLEPTSTVIVVNHSEGERAMTRPVTGFWLEMSWAESKFRARLSCAFSSRACWAPTTSLRRPSRSFWSLEARSFASNVSPTQLFRSLNGLSARLAPSWMGKSTSSMPRWMVRSGPPIDSPKYAVSRMSERPTRRARIALRLRTCLSYTLSPAAVARVLVGPVDRLELLQRPAGAHCHAGQWRLGQMRRHLGLGAQPLVQPLQQRPAARKHDATVHDVRGQLGRRAVEGLLDRVDDLGDRLLQGVADLLAREHDGLGKAGDHVAAADLGLDLLLHRVGGPDLELDLFRGLRADEQLVLPLGVLDDRLVQLVAADADRLRHDDPAQRDHGDLRGPAADVDHHVSGGLADRQSGADGGGHGLLDQVGLTGAGREAGLLDRPFLHAGHAGGDAHHHPRVRPAVLVHLLDEVAEHLLGDVEVGDHTILERSDGLDRAGRAPEHALGLDPDGVDLAGARVDRDDARLAEHDAAPAHVDQGVGRAEGDRHVAATEAGEVTEKAHWDRRSLATPRLPLRGQPLGAAGGRHVGRQSSERLCGPGSPELHDSQQFPWKSKGT